MMGFFDFEFKMDDIKKHQPPLQKLNKVIDWEIFRPILESALLNKSKAKGGHPPFDKLQMFKIIILQPKSCNCTFRLYFPCFLTGIVLNKF